ncbi:MAG: DUF126 domain-containing protein [Methanothrix sp.]|nr:DUF126 domain-containing protein [Methanothrix sp.]
MATYVICQLKTKGLAPVGMINIRSEPIVAVGAIISGIPLVDRVTEEILRVESEGWWRSTPTGTGQGFRTDWLAGV